MNVQRTISSVIIGFVLFCFGNGYAKLAPDFIRPCNETSRECLIKSTQIAIPQFVKGIPDLNVPSLDPFGFDKLTVALTNLSFTFYNGVFTGFRKCIVDNVESYLEKRKFKMTVHCNLTLKSTYEAKGKFLLFAIDGGGDAKVKLVNMKINMDINTQYVKDSANVDYFDIKSFKYTIDYGDRVYFDLKNLFKGSKELSDAVLIVLNQNWRILVEDFGKPFVNYAVDYAVKAIKIFFLAVPYNETINVPIPL